VVEDNAVPGAPGEDAVPGAPGDDALFKALADPTRRTCRRHRMQPAIRP
jgi:hypothetical protein